MLRRSLGCQRLTSDPHLGREGAEAAGGPPRPQPITCRALGWHHLFRSATAMPSSSWLTPPQWAAGLLEAACWVDSSLWSGGGRCSSRTTIVSQRGFILNPLATQFLYGSMSLSSWGKPGRSGRVDELLFIVLPSFTVYSKFSCPQPQWPTWCCDLPQAGLHLSQEV